MRDSFKLIRGSLSRDWVNYSASAVPLFLNLTAYSGFVMKKIIGYGYRGFLFIYQDGYGEMNYLTSDFKRIWNTIISLLLV